MDTTPNTSNNHRKKLLQAQTHIWTHIFNFLSSMALKCAIQLEIPDTIHNHGKPMTLQELSQALSLHPTKTTPLYRIIRFLVHSDFLSKTKLPNGEDAFTLTINSQLLLKDHPLTLSPFALAMLDPILTEPAHHFSNWFRNQDKSPFCTAHGIEIWEYASSVPQFNEFFNQAMASDSKFVGEILVGSSEFKGLLEGIGSLVDVAGGTGTLATIIAKAFPGVKCSVLDLPHVVEGLHKNGMELEYVGGDMFESIPSADVILFKWIFHDWSDDNCIKILERCKEAIPSKDQGGKVMIIDVVVDTQNVDISKSQLLFDMEMLSVPVGGKERSEEEWKQLFMKTGFSDYKIFPILGTRSLIVIYPS